MQLFLMVRKISMQLGTFLTRYVPPESVNEEDESDDTLSEFDVTTNQMIFLGLGVIIVILL